MFNAVKLIRILIKVTERTNMKKTLAIVAILMFMGSQSAEAVTKVTVTNAKKI